MIHELITIADAAPELRMKAQRVQDPTAPKVQDIVNAMIRVMRSENGIGLAAPQVAVLERIVIFDIDAQSRRTKTPMVCINPVITKASRNLVMTEEGCLSIPGEFIPVVRAESVSVRYYDMAGTKRTIHATDLIAVALQHEIDHLDGILMTDRYNEQSSLRLDFHELDEPASSTHRIG